MAKYTNINTVGVPMHSTHVMSYDKAAKMFVVDESTMQANQPFGRSFGQVYKDACDMGFALKSHRTGKVSYWHVAEEKRDAEGELQVLICEPVRETLAEMPELSGVTVHVLND